MHRLENRYAERAANNEFTNLYITLPQRYCFKKYLWVISLHPLLGAEMQTSSRLTRTAAYLAALGLVLAFHAYALHLDESSETQPARITQRQA